MIQDLYNIHGDTGDYWRIEKFLEYCEHDINDTLAPMNLMLKARGADLSDRIWACLLYSASYCLGTTMFIYDKLDWYDLTKDKVEQFWQQYRPHLIFQSDRRYVKNMNWFVPIVSDFLDRVQGNPEGYFAPLLEGTPYEVYEKMYKEVSKWRYYGRFSVILLLKTMIYVLPRPMDFHTDYDWNNGETTTAGALILKYRDPWAKEFLETNKITPEMKAYFDDLLVELKGVMDTDNMLHITSAFCSYFKLYKQTRYIGYYVDRGQDELIKLQKALPKSSYLWKEIYEARKECIPNQYLGEINGWNGIRKGLFDHFTKTGRVYLYPEGETKLWEMKRG